MDDRPRSEKYFFVSSLVANYLAYKTNRLHGVRSGLHFTVHKLLQLHGGIVNTGGHCQKWNGTACQGAEAILRLTLYRFASLHNTRRDARLP